MSAGGLIDGGLIEALNPDAWWRELDVMRVKKGVFSKIFSGEVGAG